METIESYSAELRNPNLIRASYNFLKDHTAIAHPAGFSHYAGIKTVSEDEPLMWTPAYSLEADAEVLIPAANVYFPFPRATLSYSPLFPSGSNGLASGATYLEAVIHALYEIIERYYTFLFENGKIAIEAIHDEEIKDSRIDKIKLL